MILVGLDVEEDVLIHADPFMLQLLTMSRSLLHQLDIMESESSDTRRLGLCLEFEAHGRWKICPHVELETNLTPD